MVRGFTNRIKLYSFLYYFLGSMILSACTGGMIAVSSPASGLVVRIINDHRDAPVTDLQVAPKPIQVILTTCELTHSWIFVAVSDCLGFEGRENRKLYFALPPLTPY